MQSCPKNSLNIRCKNCLIQFEKLADSEFTVAFLKQFELLVLRDLSHCCGDHVIGILKCQWEKSEAKRLLCNARKVHSSMTCEEGERALVT